MPIISRIGRRTWKVRLLIVSIYALLITGGLTMVYPFLLMLAGSTKSGIDLPDMRLLPAYLTSDRALYAKFLEGQFNETLQLLQVTYNQRVASFAQVEPPATVNEAYVAAWRDYLAHAELSPYAAFPGFSCVSLSSGCTPAVLRAFKRELRDRHGPELAQVNRALGSNFASWHLVTLGVLPPNFALRLSALRSSPFFAEFMTFAQTVPLDERYVVDLEGAYKLLFLQSNYTTDIAAFNDAMGRTGAQRYADWAQVMLPRRLDDAPELTEPERKLWEEFVRDLAALPWVRIDATQAPTYRAYLRAKYQSVAALNAAQGTQYADFAAVPFAEVAPAGGVALTDWEGFLKGWDDPQTGARHAAEAKALLLVTPRFGFQDELLQRYGDLAGINQALGTRFTSIAEVAPPQRELHYQRFLRDRAALRWEFTTRNYVSVLAYIALQGRGVFNTVVYCLLAVLCALVVNPIAAYALSRYRPPSTYRLLLFMMLTMAFPPAVTQIPVFLLLRHLGLLNSFAALLLPGLANGYWIFLLKGFFDSLPRELYESAELDGAGELRIFWQLTMSLSTPVLAVVALQAFSGAYMNFMFALLYCQDQRMWTLMVWLYQLQTNSGQGVVFASLILAAVPTFLVFACCQNVIMRGIVVPVEK